jgi:four helix bundle protein
MVQSVEELQVYKKALEAVRATSAILVRVSFERDPRLRSQLAAASERVASDIGEGFGQKTDRHFALYLHGSKVSSIEVRTQLAIALDRKHISANERHVLADRYHEIERMLTGLLKHLHREDRRFRGHGAGRKKSPA